MRAHKTALYDTRDFWRQLLQHDVSFAALSDAFNTIEASIAKADKMYRMVLDRCEYRTYYTLYGRTS